MSVEISGPPEPTAGPSFAGLTVLVPLSKEPSRVWLDLLALEDLPGKGHRVDGAALEFHLDRDSHDIPRAMRAITAAISAANATYEANGEKLEAGVMKAAAIHDDAVAKVARQLAEWWASEGTPSATVQAELPAGEV